MAKKDDKQAQTKDVWGSHRGLSLDALKRGFQNHLRYTRGRIPRVATLNDKYMAVAHTVKDRLLNRWLRSADTYLNGGLRAVSYHSAAFLMGPELANNLINLGICEEVRDAVQASGQDWNALLDNEPEPGLGNGGLGRLAACFLDSLMFGAGDEFTNTQNANNNPHNQDDEITWLDWDLLEHNRDMVRFFKCMIAFRKAHPSAGAATGVKTSNGMGQLRGWAFPGTRGLSPTFYADRASEAKTFTC